MRLAVRVVLSIASSAATLPRFGGCGRLSDMRSENCPLVMPAGFNAPNRVVLRDQMASFLARALELPASGTDYFTDDEGNTHEANINRLRAGGITTGCTATTYCPGGDVTRGQMAAFLHRAFD